MGARQAWTVSMIAASSMPSGQTEVMPRMLWFRRLETPAQRLRERIGISHMAVDELQALRADVHDQRHAQLRDDARRQRVVRRTRFTGHLVGERGDHVIAA